MVGASPSSVECIATLLSSYMSFLLSDVIQRLDLERGPEGNLTRCRLLPLGKRSTAKPLGGRGRTQSRWCLVGVLWRRLYRPQKKNKSKFHMASIEPNPSRGWSRFSKGESVVLLAMCQESVKVPVLIVVGSTGETKATWHPR